MDHDWQTELAALTHMGVSALRGKYAEVFGEPTRTGNKTWLVRRIAWRLQALAEGDLSERARRRGTGRPWHGSSPKYEPATSIAWSFTRSIGSAVRFWTSPA